MMSVAYLHRHAAAMRICGPSPLHPILMGDKPRFVEPQPAIELVIIEEHQPGRSAGRNLDIALEFIGRVTRDQQQGR